MKPTRGSKADLRRIIRDLREEIVDLERELFNQRTLAESRAAALRGTSLLVGEKQREIDRIVRPYLLGH